MRNTNHRKKIKNVFYSVNYLLQIDNYKSWKLFIFGIFKCFNSIWEKTGQAINHFLDI